MRRLKLILLAGFISRVFLAESLIPVYLSGMWGVEIHDLPLPEPLIKQSLKSGLTTHSIIEVTLSEGVEVIQGQQTLMKQFYDLWEENYYLLIENKMMNVRQKFASADALIESQRTVKLDKVGKLETVKESQPYRIKVRYLLTPIDKTKTEKIRKWIAENRVTGLSATKSSGLANSAGIRFNSLFDTILDEYFMEEGPSAKWERVLESQPFHIKGGRIAK